MTDPGFGGGRKGRRSLLKTMVCQLRIFFADGADRCGGAICRTWVCRRCFAGPCRPVCRAVTRRRLSSVQTDSSHNRAWGRLQQRPRRRVRPALGPFFRDGGCESVPCAGNLVLGAHVLLYFLLPALCAYRSVLFIVGIGFSCCLELGPAPTALSWLVLLAAQEPWVFFGAGLAAAGGSWGRLGGSSGLPQAALGASGGRGQAALGARGGRNRVVRLIRAKERP